MTAVLQHFNKNKKIIFFIKFYNNLNHKVNHITKFKFLLFNKYIFWCTLQHYGMTFPKLGAVPCLICSIFEVKRSVSISFLDDLRFYSYFKTKKKLQTLAKIKQKVTVKIIPKQTF